jgi:hypothetical protein
MGADAGHNRSGLCPHLLTLCGDISRLTAVVFKALELAGIERPSGPMSCFIDLEDAVQEGNNRRKSYEHDRYARRHENLFQGLGIGSANCFLTRMAAER